MRTARWLTGSTVLVIGALQAWDAGVLDAGPAIIALVALAVMVVSGAALLARSRGGRAAGVVAAAVLLLAARLLSPAPLPELFLIALFAAIVLLVIQPRWLEREEAARFA